MRKINNWDDIEERSGDFPRPAPGGYIARITAVYDNEAKEYLKIDWDFANGPFAGENERTHQRVGFWPTALYRSYKESALGFFKAFKTAVEASNPGYTFDTSNPLSLLDKLVGVVLGEEGYTKKDGSHGKRLYVHAVRSLDAIRSGDFTVPEYKEKDAPSASPTPAHTQQQFTELDDDDGELPF